MVYERIEMLRLKRLDVLRAKLQEAAIVVLQRPGGGRDVQRQFSEVEIPRDSEG